jgi:hypothetical protein
MLSSIHPLGERAKGNRWGLTAAAFIVGSVAGGLVAGGAAGVLGAVLEALVEPSSTAVLALATILVLLALIFDLHLFGARLPTTRQQVDENWLNRYRGWVYGVGYGFQLGLGVVTVVNTATIYAALGLAVLTGSIAGGLLIGGVFGLVRGLAIVPGRRITDPESLRAFHRGLDRWARLTTRLAPVGEFVVALILAGSIVTR